MEKNARLGIDIGGTFTDIALESAGKRFVQKVLTTSAAPEQAVIAGTLNVLEQSGIPADKLSLIIHGTTLATNAVIERKGAKTALLVTQGFRDSVEMAYENRFEQYDINVERPSALVPRYLRLPIRERMGPKGEVWQPLVEKDVEVVLPILDREEVESIAVGFLHSYANQAHELRVAELLSKYRPSLSVSLSSEVCPEVREYERFSTTVANAYVRPLMARYLVALKHGFEKIGILCPLLLMMSSGGVTTLEVGVKYPIRLIDSGPAGGAILAGEIARICGASQAISFDMGGTTAKVCLIDDGEAQTARGFEVARAYRHTKGSGLPIRVPVVEMVEIGAGGGSIARVDSMQRVTVGPDSAGAIPGPACYAQGGKLATVTDADLQLGRIDPRFFAGGKIPLSAADASQALEQTVKGNLDEDATGAAWVVCEIVDENMANAARVHAVERGKSLGGRTMVAFGGAAPLHAARMAEKLGIEEIIIPVGAGVGSAIGFLRAPISYEVVRSYFTTLLDCDLSWVNEMLGQMSEEAESIVTAATGDDPLTHIRTADMRYMGQGHEVSVVVPSGDLLSEDLALLKERFDSVYEAQYGRTIPGVDVEVLTWTVTVSGPSSVVISAKEAALEQTITTNTWRDVWDGKIGAFERCAVVVRENLDNGMGLAGPALIVEDQTSTYVPRGFSAIVNDSGYIIIKSDNWGGKQ